MPMYGHVTWQENVLTKLYLLLTWTLTLAVVGLGLTIKIDSKADSPKNYWFISVKHPILPPLQNHTSFNYLYKMSKKMTKNPCSQSDFTVNLVLTLAVSLPKTFCLMYQWNMAKLKSGKTSPVWFDWNFDHRYQLSQINLLWMY